MLIAYDKLSGQKKMRSVFFLGFVYYCQTPDFPIPSSLDKFGEALYLGGAEVSRATFCVFSYLFLLPVTKVEVQNDKLQKYSFFDSEMV